MRHLMAHFPGAQLIAAGLYCAVFGLAEVVHSAFHGKIERERKSRQSISQNTVVDVAAARVVASQGRWPFPGFTTAARILVIAVSQRLMACEPESLNQKRQQKPRRDALREIEAKASKDSEPVGHHVRVAGSSLNRWAHTRPAVQVGAALKA